MILHHFIKASNIINLFLSAFAVQQLYVMESFKMIILAKKRDQTCNKYKKWPPKNPISGKKPSQKEV